MFYHTEGLYYIGQHGQLPSVHLDYFLVLV